MRYLVKNKTTKNIVLLINGTTEYLYPKGDGNGRDHKLIDALTPQVRNLKRLRFIQIAKVEKF